MLSSCPGMQVSNLFFLRPVNQESYTGANTQAVSTKTCNDKASSSLVFNFDHFLRSVQEKWGPLKILLHVDVQLFHHHPTGNSTII